MKYSLRPMSLGEVFDQGIHVFRDFFTPTFLILLVFFIPFNIAGMMVQFHFEPDATALEGARTTAEQQAALKVFMNEFLLYIGIVAIYVGVNFILVLSLAQAAMIHTVAEGYLGRRLGLGEAYKGGLKVYLPLIGLMLLKYLIIIGGMFLCVIPGIFFALKFWAAEYALVVEKLSPVDALSRSWNLLKSGEDMGTVFIFMFLLGIVNWGIGMVAALVPVPWLVAIVHTLTQSFTLIFTICVSIVFYFSLRSKNENFDLRLLAQQIGATVPEWAEVPTYGPMAMPPQPVPPGYGAPNPWGTPPGPVPQPPYGGVPAPLPPGAFPLPGNAPQDQPGPAGPPAPPPRDWKG